MKKTLLNTVMVLGLVAGVTACSDNGDDTPPTPVEQVANNTSVTCTGVQVYADSDGVQLDITCTNPDSIDLDGGTGNPAPYIQINELKVSLPTDKVTSNDGHTIMWHRIVYPLPSGLNTSGVVVVYASNEAGDFEKVESVPFAVQTAQAPAPAPEPEPEPEPESNTPPIANNLIVNAAGAGSVSGNIVISDNEDAVAALTVDVKTAPLHGAVAWTSKTGFTYTVTAGSGYNGDDSFSYQITDSKGLKSAIKTVTVLDVADF
jgi:hypothetical protein